MFCTNCGRENPDGSKFCTGCGAPVNQAPQQEWQAPQQNFQPEQAAGAWASASPRVKQKNRWLVPAVIAVVVVAVAALGALNAMLCWAQTVAPAMFPFMVPTSSS